MVNLCSFTFNSLFPPAAAQLFLTAKDFEQLSLSKRNHSTDRRTGVEIMASYRDPELTFAPIEVVERLLQIRSEAGFAETIYLDRSQQLTDILDAYGFDIYAFSTHNDKIDYAGELNQAQLCLLVARVSPFAWKVDCRYNRIGDLV
jgi:hypothetical protein